MVIYCVKFIARVHNQIFKSLNGSDSIFNINKCGVISLFDAVLFDKMTKKPKLISFDLHCTLLTLWFC